MHEFFSAWTLCLERQGERIPLSLKGRCQALDGAEANLSGVLVGIGRAPMGLAVTRPRHSDVVPKVS